MDSGCNNQMTTNLKAFINLDELVKTKVMMRYSKIHETHGKVDVQIQLDGNKCIKGGWNASNLACWRNLWKLCFKEIILGDFS